MNTRESLLEILNNCEKNTLNNSLDNYFKTHDLGTQEKAYITNVSHQIYRYKLRFEALIFLYSHKGRDISNDCKNLLLIALCEIFFMQSIPLHASINEIVELAKKYAKNEVALINAILRKVDKEFPFKEMNKEKFLKEMKFLYPKKTKLEYEATYASLPSYLLDILRKQYSNEYAENYLGTLNEIPYYSYRFNSSKEGWQQEREELSKSSILHNYFAKSGYSAPINSKKASELYKEGFLSYQGASSQVAIEKIIETLGKEKLDGLWDCCAGVGGKSLAMAEQGIKIAYATDTSAKRIEVYKENCKRLALKEIKCEQKKMQEVELENLSCILLDAPCSGLGTLCANPDLRYKITKKSIKEVIEVQKELLDAAYTKLAEKGNLCYLTCSLNKDENENLIEEFANKTGAKIILSEYILPPACGADTLYLAILEK